MLTIAIVFIFSALALYTVGVWAEKLGGRLRWWHAIVFYLGVVCDTIGTGAMGVLAGGILLFTLHGITGALALALMVFHALWATVVLVKKDEAARGTFHRFSLFVWVVWLVPMVSGMILGSAV